MATAEQLIQKAIKLEEKAERIDKTVNSTYSDFLECHELYRKAEILRIEANGTR